MAKRAGQVVRAQNEPHQTENRYKPNPVMTQTDIKNPISVTFRNLLILLITGTTIVTLTQCTSPQSGDMNSGAGSTYSNGEADAMERSYLSFGDIMEMTYPFELAPLPYAPDALEPAIDAQTMNIHHGKHHQGYINKLNAALEPHAELHGMTLAELNAGWNSMPAEVQSAVRNHGGGTLNHYIFWNVMSPDPTAPSEALMNMIDRDFGSFDAMAEEFASAASTVFGSGWAWLVLDDEGKLHIRATANQDNPLSDGLTPLMGVDVWEHAYYLNYQNRRGDYLGAFLGLIDWAMVEANYAAASES